jgi:head-tail adaptor
MSFGKMDTFIDIISTVPIKDAEGFVTKSDNMLASVRAYKEDRHGSEKWTNMASFSNASSLFRFRIIPGFSVTTEMFIACEDGRYQILSVEDVRSRGMYLEVLAEKLEPTVG